MTARTKAGHAFTLDKAQLQMGAPARVCLRWVDLLRQRHPGTPEIRGLAAGLRVKRGGLSGTPG